MGEIRTGDGVTLRYLEAGSGSPLVIVPGWSATAATFHHQLDGLSERCRVIALDPRGHGTSDKPAYGYRVSRLAADVHDLLAALDLREVTLLGHSSVVWSSGAISICSATIGFVAWCSWISRRSSDGSRAGTTRS